MTEDGTVLDTWFPDPELGAYSPSGTTRLAPGDVRGELAALAGPDPDRGVEVVVVRTVITALEDPPADTYDAYLRLHLLSHRLVEPHGLNLDGIFGVLTNVVWTSHGPCPVEGFEHTRLRHEQLRQGLGPIDADRGWGHKYSWSVDQLKADWDRVAQCAVDVRAFGREAARSYAPHWWQPLRER